MSHHRQHPYRTQRGPKTTDWALVAFILCAYGYVMHQDHQAELKQHIAEVKAQQATQAKKPAVTPTTKPNTPPTLVAQGGAQ